MAGLVKSYQGDEWRQSRYDVNMRKDDPPTELSPEPLKDLPDSTVDLPQLAKSIKEWGEKLGFQKVSIADAGADMRQAETGLFDFCAHSTSITGALSLNTR